MTPRASFALASVVAALAPASAFAQIGSGWTKLTLTADYIDTQSMGRHQRHPIASFTTSGARYEKNGTTETFELYDPSFNRVEHDTNHHYRTGSVQFEGIVQIYPGVNHQFIVQNFNAAGSGPIMALSAFSGSNGRIVKQGGSVEVASNAFGRDIRVNIIHDLDANTLAVYIDGKLAWSGGGGAGGGGFNFKYGSYGSLNESRSAKARWQNVQMWTGGRASGGPGPAPDAGPPADAVVRDAAPAADTGGGDAAGGSGGSGGTGGRDAETGADVSRPEMNTVDATPAGPGTGGSGGGVIGTGGSGGSGGSGGRGGGSGGRGGTTGGGPEPTPPSGCSCRLGDAPGDGVLLPLLAVVALVPALVRRRARPRR